MITWNDERYPGLKWWLAAPTLAAIVLRTALVEVVAVGLTLPQSEAALYTAAGVVVMAGVLSALSWVQRGALRKEIRVEGRTIVEDDRTVVLSEAARADVRLTPNGHQIIVVDGDLRVDVGSPQTWMEAQRRLADLEAIGIPAPSRRQWREQGTRRATDLRRALEPTHTHQGVEVVVESQPPEVFRSFRALAGFLVAMLAFGIDFFTLFFAGLVIAGHRTPPPKAEAFTLRFDHDGIDVVRGRSTERLPGAELLPTVIVGESQFRQRPVVALRTHSGANIELWGQTEADALQIRDWAEEVRERSTRLRREGHAATTAEDAQEHVPRELRHILDGGSTNG